MKEIRKAAKERLKGFCRVCPECNGIACAGEVPGMGGIGTGAAFKANIAALAHWRLNMRLLHDVAEPGTAIDFLGKPLRFPVLAAPIGGVAFNMGDPISEEMYISAVLEGCVAAGTMGCTGDGVPDFIHEAGFSAIKALDGRGIPFIKPWQAAELEAKIDKALAAGADIIGMDVDAAGLVTLKLMGRPVTPKSPQTLRRMLRNLPAKLILKGIMTPDDARRAVDVGAHAIVVSNHGGRVLDHTPGVAEVLPEIAAAVKGKITILADGGIRSGGDVLKMVALGADAVMIGRPISVAAVGALKSGVATYLRQIESELIAAMVLTGTPDIAAADPAILRG